VLTVPLNLQSKISQNSDFFDFSIYYRSVYVPGARIEALSVTVTTAIGCAGVVFAAATRHIHFGEVKGAVHAARERRQVDIERKLFTVSGLLWYATQIEEQ